MDIGTNEKRNFFNKFHYELLTSKEENKTAIDSFVATEEGKSLEYYLKNKAWLDDSDGETRIYLVKDEEDYIAMFFSIKCGLLYKKYQYDELASDKREFVNLLIDAMQRRDDDVLIAYQESGMYSEDEMNKLFEIAYNRIDLKMEEKQLHDEAYTLKVEECFSAIEIQHFCKNSAYKRNEKTDVPLGFGIFWELIVPLVCDITNKIGCKYLYLFAADQTLSDDTKKLIQYYKNDLKFNDVEDMMLIKPYYDTDCLGLMQEISELQSNRNAVWEEFSDVGE